jgi:prevent-host-death family protein
MHSQPVTTFGAHSDEVLATLDKTREPILLIQNDRPAAYLVDVASFDALQRRVRILEGIARGERAIKEGRVLSQSEAKKKLARWLK